MKRLVLIDRKCNRLCGDTAAAGTHTPISTSAAQFEDDVPVLAASAARLFGRSLGKIAHDYIFMPFTPDQNSEGYLIFDCSSCEDALPPIAPEPRGPDEALNAVTTKCPYVGYIRRGH